VPKYRSFTVDDAVKAAKAALSWSVGKKVAIGSVRELSGDQRRNLILRALAVGDNGSAKPIIIKATRAADYDAAAVDAYERFGLVKEWAAATLLAGQARRRGRQAAFLAGDAVQGVLVFEDFGEDLQSLVNPLLHGSASEAEQALITYAIALARLHADTIFCQREHAEIIRAAFPRTVQQLRWPGALTLGDDWMHRVVGTAPLSSEAFPERELKLISERLQSPGVWFALVHGDPCPDNVLLTGTGTAELIDFEFATPGHALLDAAYWRMGFPTCWCAGRVPKAIGARLDRAYRGALAEAVPLAADDDAFRLETAFISVAWLLASLAWLLERALKEDTSLGYLRLTKPYSLLSRNSYRGSNRDRYAPWRLWGCLRLAG
jgi:phosphotransferase family enzyme